MIQRLPILFFLTFCSLCSWAQINISASTTTYDSILTGTPMYYQYSWDDPLDEIRDTIQLPKPFKAFDVYWDSALVSDGSLTLMSKSKPGALFTVDATGWDLMDKGWLDTVNFPNVSPIMVSAADDEVEWRGFGFSREYDTLGDLPSTGNVKIKLNADNSIDFIYGDFSMIRPDLCFEGFGGLRPSVSYFDGTNYYDWILYGDPSNPKIDSTSIDTAFNSLPVMGQKVTINFAGTNFIKPFRNSSLLVYPNPAKSVLNVDGQNFTDGAFKIVSLEGKIIFEGRLQGNQLSIESLKNGCYLLSVEGNGGRMNARFIKAGE